MDHLLLHTPQVGRLRNPGATKETPGRWLRSSGMCVCVCVYVMCMCRLSPLRLPQPSWPWFVVGKERASRQATCMRAWTQRSTSDSICRTTTQPGLEKQSSKVAGNPLHPHFSSAFQIRLVYSGLRTGGLAALILEQKYRNGCAVGEDDS